MSRAQLRFFFALFLLQTGAYFVPPATWNPVSRFGLTRAIVEAGSFELGPLADATGDRAHVGERWYSEKSPIPSFLAVPAYAVTRAVHLALGREPPTFVATSRDGIPAVRVEVNRSFAQLLYACAVAAGAVPYAVLGWLLLGFLLRRFAPVVAVAGAGLMMLGSLLLPYATSFYGHVLAACALFGAAVMLDERAGRASGVAGSGRDIGSVASRTGVVSAGRQRTTLVLAGALLGLATVTEYLSSVPGLALAGWAVFRAGPHGRVTRLGLLALGALAPALAIAGYNTACFGAPWRSGYSFVTLPVFVAGHARGLMGVSWPDPEALWLSLFGSSRGLFVLTPLALVGAAGLVAWLRERRDDHATRALAAGLLALLVVNSGYYMWWGGAATGPRHLVPALPVLAVGVAWALTRPWWRAAAVVAGIASCLVMLAFAGVGVEAPERDHVLSDYLFARLAQGKVAGLQGASNLGVLLGLPVAASLAPLLAWWLIGGRELLAAARPSRFDSGQSIP